MKFDTNFVTFRTGMSQIGMLESLETSLENMTYWRVVKEYVYMLDQIMGTTNGIMDSFKGKVRK